MELLRFNYIDGEDVLSDGQIHNLYYGLMSGVIDEPSPSFSPETQPIEIAPGSPDLFGPPSSSAARDLLNLAVAAERAAAATVEVNTGAAKALSALAAAVTVMVRNHTNERSTTTRAAAISTEHRLNPSTPRRGTNDSNGHRSNPSTPRRGTNDTNGHGSNPSTPRRGTNDSNGHRSSPSAPRRGTVDSTESGSSPSASRSNSSSPYYGEAPLCVVCMDEMLSPGVTDGSCNHRSTCTLCLRRILFYAHGPALYPLCREPYYRVY